MPLSARLGLVLTLAILLVALLLAAAEWTELSEGVDRDEAATGTEPWRREAPPDAHLRGTATATAAEGIDRDLDLHGRVVDEAGRPIQGARLEVVTYPARGYPSIAVGDEAWRAVTGPDTTSAQDGTFALRLAPDAVCCLRARKGGYAPVELTDLHAGERIEIVLRPGVALRLRVYDEAGRPIEGCRLRLFRPWYGDAVAYERRGVTDDAGEHRFADLPPGGEAWLEPSALHHGTRAWMRMTIPEAGESVETIELPTGRTLRGRVTDAATERPVPGARVGIGRDLRRAVRTDAEGRYVLEGWVARSNHCLYVEADGYARAQQRVRDREVLDFALLVERLVLGRVVGADGVPVPGAQVAAVGHHLHPDLMFEMSTATDTSDAAGRFRLRGLRRDLPLRLIVRAAGHGRGVLELGALGEDAEPWDLGDVVMPAPRRLTGHVLDPEGRPVARLYVYLRGPDVPEEPWRPRAPDYGRGDGEHTDDLGRFVFTGLPPGVYRLDAGSGAARVKREIVVPADTDVEGVTIRLASPEHWQVSVLDEAGDPVSGITLQLRLEDGAFAPGRKTDDAGEAAFASDVRPAAVLVRLHFEAAARFAPVREVAWPADSQRTVVRLRTARLVSGVVHDPQGRPFRSAEVLAIQGDTQRRAWTDEQGAFRFPFAENGEVDLVVTGVSAFSTGDRPSRYVRRPVEGRTTATPPESGITLTTRTLPTAGSLTIQVLDPEGRPVAGALLTFQPGLPLPTSPLVADDSGQATLEGIDARPLEIWARPPPGNAQGLAPAHAIDVVPDGSELVLRLEAILHVTGLVLSPDDQPVAGATVRLDDPQVRGSVRTDAEGRFVLALFPSYVPATLLAEHRPRDGVRWAGRVEDVGPDRTDVTIQLQPE